MSILSFSFDGVAPICLMVLLGMLLRRVHLLSVQTAEDLNKLCFQLFIPCQIFSQLYVSDLSAATGLRTTLYSLAATVLVLLLLSILVPRFVKKDTHRGEFIQGVFRSNSAILGVPLLVNLYGKAAVTALSLALPLMIILYNVCAPIVLARCCGGESPDARKTARKTARKVLSNPILIAALLGFLIAGLKISFPAFLKATISSVGAVGTPMALIALGAVTEVSNFRKTGRLALSASLLRLVLIPLIVLPIGALIGIRGEQMGVLVCFFSTPTAVGGYVLAQNIDGDGELAGQILLQTTLLSFVTMFVTIALLRSFGVM